MTDESRLENILSVLVEYTLGDFSSKIEVYDEGDYLDAISAGVNTLGEELDYTLETEKKLRVELEQVNKKLEGKVVKRTEQLKARNNDLETLLYIVSHDLKEPIRAIEYFSKKILKTVKKEALTEKETDYLNRVHNASIRGKKLIEDILQHATVRNEKYEFASKNFTEAVEAAKEKLQEKIRLKKATINLENPLPDGQFDQVWITHAIYNLLSNSIKFTPPSRHPEISIKSFHSETEIGLEIQDNGMGITDDQFERIFKLFHRGVGREIEGTGAGLAIVSEIAQKHGGKVWVESSSPEGTIIIFTITKKPKYDSFKQGN